MLVNSRILDEKINSFLFSFTKKQLIFHNITAKMYEKCFVQTKKYSNEG